jgi:glucose 1-dehydrogenase
MELEGKTALVTGGAVRLGRALALALAEAGCAVLVHYGRSEEAAEDTCRAIRALGGRAERRSADLSDPAAPGRLVQAAVDAFGHLDVLINSAALFLEGGVEETSIEVWDRQFAVNLRAPFLLSRAFARQLPEGRRGRILNLTDARIFRPGTDHFAYRLTKGALAALTENLALALAPRITVNALALGAILPPPDAGDDYLERLVADQVPLRRAGGSEAVTRNALHLLRDDFVTGVVLKVEGGQFL